MNRIEKIEVKPGSHDMTLLKPEAPTEQKKLNILGL